MLAKVDVDYTFNTNQEFNYTWNLKATLTDSSKGTWSFANFWEKKSTAVSISGSLVMNTNNARPNAGTIGIINTKIWDITAGAYWAFTYDFNNISIPANTDLTAYFTMNNASWYINYMGINSLNFKYLWPLTVSKTSNIKGKPRELKNITQKASTTIFGIHTDRTRITQETE